MSCYLKVGGIVTKLIYTYSLVKTLYEQGKDYIDSFWPFVLKVLKKNKTYLDLNSIQDSIRENFGLDIPLHSLNVIITRAKRKGFIKQQKLQFILTEKGGKHLDSLEPESDIERRINELIEDIKSYLNEQLKLSLTSDETKGIFLSFVNKHIESLVAFFNPESSIIRLDAQSQLNNRYDSTLIDYLEISKQRKPNFYNTLVDVIYGSVISTVASNRNIAEVNKKFSITKVFLDSNYLLSILGLHAPNFNKPAQELLHLLITYEFELRVFDFTIEEMVRVLKNYSREHHLYIKNVPVKSIYSNLKNIGFTTEDVREFIAKIESKIWQLGIKIETTNINLDDYKPKKDEYRTQLSQYKPNQNVRTQNHDLAAIDKTGEIRGKLRREIESSKAFFLTSDFRLSKFNFIVMKHRENATVCEVIPDRLITNILWLKNPTIIKDIPLKSIIAIHSHGMFIERNIWIRFCEIIKDLKEKNKIEEKDISMLFYNHHIEEVLKTFDESETDEIMPSLIFDELKKVNKLIDEETKKKLKEQGEIFEKKLSLVKLEKEMESEKRLDNIKARLKSKAIKKAKKYTLGIMCVPLFVFVGAFIYFTLVKNWSAAIILGVIGSITGILSFFDVKVSLRNIFKELQDKTFQNIYKKDLSELKLEDDIEG